MSERPSDSENASPWRVAVVGGGISGLATAYRLGERCRDMGRPLEVMLFEGGFRLGGVVGTRRIDDYLTELGADSFITNKPWAVDLCRRLGLEVQLIGTDPHYRRSLVLRNGKPLPVPEGFMLLSPSRIWPVLTSSIFSPLGKMRLGLEYFVPRRIEEADESLASFVRRRFGQEALERLVQPLVGGIYTSDPEKLSLRATMSQFIDMERDHRSLIRASRKSAKKQAKAERSGSGARYALFLTLKEGLSELVQTLEKQILDFTMIRMNTSVVGVQRREAEHDSSSKPPGWQLQLQQGTSEEFDAVVLAVPAYSAAEILENFNPDLAAMLSRIEYASSAVVVSGHRLEDIEHPLDAFGLVIPAVENRRVLAVSFSSRKFPGRAPDGRVLLRTFVGGALQPTILDYSDEELLNIVRGELKQLLGVGGQEDFATVTRYHRAMPQYHVGHLDLVGQIEQQIGHHPGLELAGNAYRGVGLPDCIHSGEQAAERVIENLVANPVASARR